MRVFATDHFVLPLPSGHRFPMGKYSLLRERVAGHAPEAMRVADPASDDELALAHSRGYIRAITDGTLDARAQRRIGFPWTPAMVERSRRSVGATIAASRSAMQYGCGINLAGGTHHAHRANGSGFCVFNDAAVACRVLQAEGRIRRALIVDLDVHQGDGTAAILAEDPAFHTLSLHGRNNFPFRKQSSGLDVELDDGTGDAAYLAALRVVLPLMFSRARPDLVVYLAGADPFAGDRLGRLALSKEGLAQRDREVLSLCMGHGVPVAIAMAGGYANRVEDTVDIHFNTVSEALAHFGTGRVLDSPADGDSPRAGATSVQPRTSPP
jgi:acetoin utilization deacetylase AcuC-like enzyme